jgi:rhodanese-related sulfurtransferase
MDDEFQERIMKEINAKEAYEQMQKDPNCIYLDVRSIPEYEQGHPVGSINIPLMHFQPGMGMVPNEDFVRVVETNLPKDATLIVGCKTGGRSSRACEILAQLGYSNLTNVRGGFVGAMDNAGRIVEPGWSLLNLPVASGTGDDASYEKLASKVKK